MTIPDSVKLEVRYRYLLFRKNGSVLPLIAVEDLPSMVTVFPPLDVMGGITLVQEIEKPSEGAPNPGMISDGAEQVPANGGGMDEYENGDDKNDRIGTTPSGSRHTCLGPPMKTHTCAVVGSPPFHRNQQGQASLEIDRFYLHPNHSQARLQKESLVSPSSPPSVHPEALAVRESRLKASGLFRKDLCQSFLRDASCKWGGECTFRHETPLRPEKWLKSNCDQAPDDSGSTEETMCEPEPHHGNDNDKQSSSGEDGDNEDEGEVGNESGTTITTADGEVYGIGDKSKKPELCAYFHRKVGCKRGSECFYLHDNESASSVGGKYTCFKKTSSGGSGNGSPTNPKKMEGDWRRSVEPPVRGEEEEDKKLPSTTGAEALKHGGIACPTPGRVPSTTDPLKHIKTHCTFFLRFGECDYWPSCKFSHERPEGILTPPPSLSPIPATGFTRWRSSRLPSAPADKGNDAAVGKKTSSREKRGSGIPLPSLASTIEGPTARGRFSLLDRSSSGTGLQEPIKTTDGVEENGAGIAEGQLITLAD